MTSRSTRSIAASPIRPDWRRPALVGGASASLLAVYAAVRLTGGAPNPLVHFAYIGIVLAALGAGWRGGLLAGIGAGLLMGPLMPDSTAASVGSLGEWGWAVRFAAYAVAGGVIGWSWDRAQQLVQAAQQRAFDARQAEVLRASEERLRRTVDAAADGIIAFDAGRRLTLCNGAAERLLGIPRVSLEGMAWGDIAEAVGLRRPSDSPEVQARIAAALASGRGLPPSEVTIRRTDGTECRLQVSARPLDLDAPDDGLVVNLHEVTAEHALAQQRAVQLAELQAAGQAAAAAPSAGAAAEALLAQFARTWSVAAAAIYLIDASGAQRLAVWTAPETGGPIPPLVPGSAAAELRELASHGPIRIDLSRLPGDADGPRLLAGRGARSLLVLPLIDGDALVGALLAGARLPPEPLGSDEQTHLRAMGGLAAGIVHRAVVDEEVARRRERGRIEQVLTTPSLLVPHYQPIIALADRSVVGYEALARFRSEPVQSPDRWFSQAEDVGLGARLQALAIARARGVARTVGLPAGAFLSINVSPRHLASAAVRDALVGDSLGRLVIEVTEEEAVADYAALRDAMTPYLARGARVAVDDAGAGYASMRHVTELRPDFVKLDAQLIRGLRDDTARQALVQALVGFTATIGATTIAEGVEEPADLALLARTRQPLLAQGYAIARPGPAWPAIEPYALAGLQARRRRVTRLEPRLAGS